MIGNRLIIQCPVSTSGYAHLNSLKFYDIFDREIVATATSNSAITLKFFNGDILTGSCSASQYSGSYAAFHAINTGSYYCSPSKTSQGVIYNWVLTLNRRVVWGREIKKITFSDVSLNNYPFKVYVDTNGKDIEETLTARKVDDYNYSIDSFPFYMVVVKKGNNYYYLPEESTS